MEVCCALGDGAEDKEDDSKRREGEVDVCVNKLEEELGLDDKVEVGRVEGGSCPVRLGETEVGVIAVI